MYQAFLVGDVGHRLANIVQQGRQFHARCREHRTMKNVLLLRLLQQFLYFPEVALSTYLQRRLLYLFGCLLEQPRQLFQLPNRLQRVLQDIPIVGTGLRHTACRNKFWYQYRQQSMSIEKM